MTRNGPIVVIDDDIDDLELYQSIFSELGTENEIRVFQDCGRALAYLQNPEIKPFLIFSDLNMPLMNGFEMRSIIAANPELQPKCIPYLFFTTDASVQSVTKAYLLSVQGIFQKPSNYERWKLMLEHILVYWNDCMFPK